MKRAQKHGRFATRLHWIAAAAAAVLLPGAARAELTHRYSFNIDTNDSIGGATGTLVNGAAVTGGRLVLANNGTNSDPATGQYLDLPNGLAQTSNLTIEFWSTWNGGNNWQRFFDFGYTTDGANSGELFPGQAPASYNGVEYLFVSPRKGSGGNPFGSELREGGVSDFTDSTTGPYPAGEHHVALTIDGAARTMTLYMDGGVVRETLNITRDPAAIDMLNVWIGRSNFRGDAFFNGSFNEFRIYNSPLSAGEIAANYAAGPDIRSVWTAADGDWDMSSNWSSNVVPMTDIVAVIDNGGIARVNSSTNPVADVQVVSGSIVIGAGGSLATRVALAPADDVQTAGVEISGGGRLTTSLLTAGATGPAANKTIHIDGGTLAATGAFTLANTATTTVGAGGATFEVPDLDPGTGMTTVNWQPPLVPAGPSAILEKRAGGALVLAGGGYEAPVNIRAGTLALAGSVGVVGTSLQLGDTSFTDGFSATLRLTAPATVHSPIVSGTDNSGEYALEASADAAVSVVGGVSLNSSLTVRSAATTGDNALTFAGGIQSLNPSNATLTFDNAGLIVVDTADAVGSTGVADAGGGSLNVVKLGTGTVRLMDPSTYTGSTTINNGILHFESPASVGGSGQSVVLASNLASNTFGVAGLGAGFDHSNIKGTFLNRLNYGSEGVVALSSDSDEDFDFTDGSLNLPPSIYLGSLGEVIYTGTITNWTGEYRLGGGGGTLYVGDPANPVPNRLTGGQILVVGGAPGTVVLTAPNDYTGGTMIQRGAVLSFSAPDQLGTGLITFDNGTLRLTGPNTVALTQITDVNAGISIDVPDPAGSLMFTGGFFGTGGGQFYKLGEGAFAMSTSTFDLIDKPFLLRGGTTSIIDGATVNTTGWTSISVGLVDPNEKATLIVDNGQLTADGDFNVGDVANSQGTLILRNGSITARTVYVGKNTTTQGAVLQTGGQFVNGAGFGDWRIGGSFGAGDAQAVGAYTMTGGTFSTAANLQIGAWGRGVMTVAGGLATAGNWPAVGRFAGSYGVLNVLDTGVFNQTGTGNRMIVGENGAGIVNVADGGTLNTVSDVVLALGDGGSGVVNLLPDGTINTIGVRRGAGANRQATFNFHGGTLRATTTGQNLMGGLDAAYVWSGGAIIDTNGHDVTVSQSLSAPTGDGLTGVSLASGGAGYVAHPVVEISGGGGSGASAIPVLDGAGAITAIRITNPGVGYTSAPTVAIKGGGAAQAAVVDAVTTGPNESTGGLIKIGAGTLTLAAPQSYNGATVIAEGTLRLVDAPVTAAAWNANSIQGATGDNVLAWVDSVAGKTAAVSTNPPKLAVAAINGHNAIRFDGAGQQGLQVFAADNPIGGNANFTIAMVFKTSTNGVGGDGQWWQNSGLVDAEEPGATQDWGMSLNGTGQIGAGIGNVDRTAYSQAGLADGNAHVAIFSKQGDVITLNVDGVTTIAAGAPTAARNAIRFTIGHIQTNANYFTGDIAELRMFSAGLYDHDIAALGSALAAEYGTAGTYGSSDILPVGTAVSINAAGAALDLGNRTVRVGSVAGVEGSEVRLGAGTLIAGGDGSYTTFAGVISGTGGIVKEGAGTWALEGINLYEGKTTIAGGGLRVGGSIDSSSLISVDAGALALDGGADPDAVLAATAAKVAQGYSGGNWDGIAGITSAAARDDAAKITGLAVVLNSDGADGPLLPAISPVATDTIVTPALYGDTNLDHRVDGLDYFALDAAFLAGEAGSWRNGDSDYNGVHDGDDFFRMDKAFSNQSALSAGPVSVPEPGAGVLLIMAGLLAGRRRTRR